MGKKATTIEEQIELLRSRGMDFDVKMDDVKKSLLNIGYYRLGFYWYPFEKDKKHNFKEFTFFSDVISLYHLDFEIRRVLIDYLNILELNFKTKVIYYVSNKYKTHPRWFSENAIMKPFYIGKLDQYYNSDFKIYNRTIKNHHLNNALDKYAPAWKTLEYFSFGQVYKTYENLKDERLQKEIAILYGYRTLDYFTNHMSNLVRLRNVCAHNGVLFDYNSPTGYNQFDALNLNDKNIHCLDTNIKVLAHLLSSIDKKLSTDFINTIDKVFLESKKDRFLRKIITGKINYKY